VKSNSTATSGSSELWLEELERWFDEGPESDEIVLIKVTPSVVEYWNGKDNGELTL
jgi:general stress protein 26